MGALVKTSVERLDVLTSLRFFAAFAVFVYHAKIFDGLLEPYKLGEVGVAFFFLLSGFIMTYVYLEKLAKRSRRGTLKFYAARLAKIYPMHLLTFLVAAPGMMRAYGMVFGGPVNGLVVGSGIANLFLVQAYFSSNVGYLYSYNNVSWTLSVEMLFYLVFPFVMAFASRHIRQRSIRQLGGLAFGLWLIMLFCSIVLPGRLQILPIIRLPEFLIGMMIGFIYLKGAAVRQFIMAHASSLEVLSVLAVIASIGLYPLLPTSISTACCLAPALGFFILVFAHQPAQIARVLSRRPFVFLGEISFSFYMVHMMIIGRLNAAGSLSRSVLALGITLVVSSLAYLVIEEPARKAIKRLADRRIDRRTQRPVILEPDTSPVATPSA